MYKCAYIKKVEFEWNSKKAQSNLKKHGIDFTDAISVLEDESAITIHDEHPDEERFITIGRDVFGRIIVIVYTWRLDRIRIISSRKATVREINQ